MKKRILSLLCVIAMCVTVLPINVVAAVDADGNHLCAVAESDCIVCDVAHKINSLPEAENITIENAAMVTNAVHEIDRIKGKLTDEEYDELLTLVEQETDESGQGLNVPARYMQAVDVLKRLNAGGSLYVSKKFVGEDGAVLNLQNAEVALEVTDIGNNRSFTLTMATLDAAPHSLGADLDYYQESEDGWTYSYALPAGTYRIKETGDSGALINEVDFITGKVLYNDEENEDGVVVSVNEAESTTVTLSNMFSAPTVYVGGKAMMASPDGAMSTYLNEAGEVSNEAPENYVAKAWYDTENDKLNLDLNNINVTSESYLQARASNEEVNGAGIYTEHPLVINLEGDNTIVGATETGDVYGIYAQGLTINATEEASLNIMTGESSSSNYGIYSTGNTFINNAVINITVGDAKLGIASPDIFSAGIYAVGKLVLNDADVETIAGKASGQSAGIFVKSSASNASLYFTGGGESESGAGSSITPGDRDGSTTADGGLTVNGGRVDVNSGIACGSGMSTAFSDGIYADGAITFNNAEVSATSDFGTQGTYGIESAGSDITINGGIVTATSGSGIPTSEIDNDGRNCFSVGVSAKKKFTVTAGVVTVSSSQSRNSAYGIYAMDDVTISGGEVIAEAGMSEVQSTGIYADNNLFISDDAEVNATASMAGYRSYGTFVKNSFHMSGASSFYTWADITTETSAYTTIRSVGLYMGDDRSENISETDTLTITGGTFTASCNVTDETTSTENYAVLMYNVADDKFIFSDTSQTNDKWYIWSVDSNGEEEWSSLDKEYVYKDVDENYKSSYLYIAPIIQTHEVTFYPRSSSEIVPNPAIVDDGDTVAKPDPDPTKDGFRFVGWFTSNDDGATLDEEPYDFDTPVHFNFNLYGKWEPVSAPTMYTVTYDLNGGTGADGVDYSVQTVAGGTEITVKAAPTKNGYTFNGYSLGTSTYNPGDKIIVNEDITLIAQWRQNSTPGGGSSTPRGSVILTKVDANDNSTVIPNVEFKLYKSNGSLVGTHTTDKDGKVTVNRLQTGKYYWQETRPAEGYVLDDTKHEFEIVRNKTTEITVTNKRSNVPSVFRDEHYAYVVGYPDGLVRPEANITRAEVATIFFRLLNDEAREQYMTKVNDFSDVDAEAWYNTAVSTMAKMGIVKGYPDGEFKPDENITRAEFAAIAARFDEKAAQTNTMAFSDIINHWASYEISKAVANGWVLGYEDGTFRPEKNISRAEAMTLLNRVLQRIPESTDDLLDGMIEWPDNANTEVWYYLAVQEATNSHKYSIKANGHEEWTELDDPFDWTSIEK